MTSKEMADELGIKESYLRTHWSYICNTREKMNIYLFKVGCGSRANYGIQYYDDEKIRWTPRIKGEVTDE